MPLSREEHLFGPGPKRILSLDGGGVRGLVTLGLLAKVESVLKARSRNESFRLCDYFDLIGGTSTGALIATLLALGYAVDEIIGLYKTAAPDIFRKRRLFQGIQSKFDSTAFRRAVEATLRDFLRRSNRDPDDLDVLRMNSDLLRTGLALVTKRIDTGSVWVLTNNRKAKYWDGQSALWSDHFAAQDVGTNFYPNSDYPLATIVRASASAPFYLDGVDLRISKGVNGHFLDGGASPFNNPCQELFLMATLRDHSNAWTKDGVSPFGFNWQTGQKQLFMLSLGSGTWRNRIDSKKFAAKTAAMKAVHALAGIIDDADKAATTWMQAISESPTPYKIDSNLLEMQQLRITPEPLLTFRRVTPLLEHDWLEDKLGPNFKYSKKDLADAREIDRADPVNLERLLQIGRVAGEMTISDLDFPSNFD